nr:RNA-directed DNA polymerase, eukaryota [Tanacetum cinerariifolium]
MSAYSFTMHHLASCLLSILQASFMVSYKDDLYKLLLVQVMAASTIHVSAEKNLGNPINIRVDIIHPEPVAVEHLLGVPIQEELTALMAVKAGIFTGFRVDHSITLSNLFYADDAVFIGEWSHSNLKGIMNILRCFSLLS